MKNGYELYVYVKKYIYIYNIMWFHSNVTIQVDQNVVLTSWHLLILKLTLVTERWTEDIGFIKCDCCTRWFIDWKTEKTEAETNLLNMMNFNFFQNLNYFFFQKLKLKRGCCILEWQIHGYFFIKLSFNLANGKSRW